MSRKSTVVRLHRAVVEKLCEYMEAQRCGIVLRHKGDDVDVDTSTQLYALDWRQHYVRRSTLELLSPPRQIGLQHIFDLAWQAFVVERKPPGYEKSSCRYLTEDGRKCAVGLALPDGHLCQSSLLSFGNLVASYPELFDVHVNQMDELRLLEFQVALHDNLQFAGKWPSRPQMAACYRNVAAKYELAIPGE